MAAGVSLGRGQLDAAMTRLGALVARAEAAPETDRPLRVAGLVAPAAADLALAEAIASAGPYGAEAPAPRIVVADARLVGLRRLGGGHLALSLSDGAGRLEAVAFRAADGPLGAFLAASTGARIHLAGRLEVDAWGGRRRVKLHVEDAAPTGGGARSECA
jgi:single-stranded-DNA-specific exonuclease